MKFISSVKMKGRPGKRKEIIQTINGLLDQLRLRKGCLDAATYQDIDDENIFYLVEEWRTQEDLDEYLDSKLFAVLLGIETILAETPKIKILSEDCSYHCGEKKNVLVN